MKNFFEINLNQGYANNLNKFLFENELNLKTSDLCKQIKN